MLGLSVWLAAALPLAVLVGYCALGEEQFVGGALGRHNRRAA
jgi:hypothetical protein